MTSAQLPGAGSDERFALEHRLRRRADYQHCYRLGRRRHGPLATLYIAANQLGHPRLGITASKKVGKAVVRQQLKRRTREIYRRWPGRARLPAVDLVVHFKPDVAEADFQQLQDELWRLLRSVGSASGGQR